MKKIFNYLFLLPILALALVGCKMEEIEFDHEKPAFDIQDGKILIEAILPTSTAADDPIYIAGPFAGDSAYVVNQPMYRLTHSNVVKEKWGIYLDPSTFKDGKTLADGFFFVNVEQGIERSLDNKSIRHKLNATPGQRYNVYADRWRSYFATPVEPEDEKLPEHSGIRVYVLDNSGWDAIALYQWGDVNDFGGGWPGAAVAGTETLGGKEYKYFEYGDDLMGLAQHLIFNNNGGGTQHPDYDVTFAAADYFFEVTAEGVSEIDAPVGGVTLPDHDGYRVYVTDNTSWDALALYMWGDVNDYGGGWPGAQPTGTETIAGVEYTFFEYPDDLGGLAEHLIFNNNNGGTQLADFDVTFAEPDYFINITDDGAELLPNPAGGGGITPPEPPKPTYDGPKVYVVNNTEWPGKLYAHYWGDGFGTDWPGTEITETETIDGVDYLVLPTLTSAAGQPIGIIFHSDENDAENRFETELTLDTDRLYVLEANALTEVDGGVRVIVKDNSGWPGTIYAHMWDDDMGTEWPGVKGSAGYFDSDTYLVFLAPAAFTGKTVNVIFHSDENDADNRFQTTITLDKDRFYNLNKEFNFAEQEKKPVSIYVDDKTGWDDIALYMWGEVNDLGGGWPGVQVTRTEEIMGTTFKVFEVPAAFGLKEVLIFNNNNNGSQLSNYPDDSGMVFEKEEYFFVVTAEGVTPSERPSIDPAKRVTIYVDDQTGWDEMALYMWGDSNDLGGGWPGVQPGEPVTVAGKEFKTFVIENAIGLSENLIFNNNNHGEQLGDYALTFEQNEYWFSVNAREVIPIDNPSTVTVCVDDQTGWDAIALYMWGDVNDLGGGWPGILPSGTETVGGTTYKLFVIEGGFGLTENLIFNNNNNGVQLGDFNLKFEKNRYYLKVTAEGVTLVE